MLSRISQIKQTLSDEFEQAVGPQRAVNDPIAVIERNARLLKTETPDVNDILIDPEADPAPTEPPATESPETGAPAEPNASELQNEADVQKDEQAQKDHPKAEQRSGTGSEPLAQDAEPNSQEPAAWHEATPETEADSSAPRDQHSSQQNSQNSRQDTQSSSQNSQENSQQSSQQSSQNSQPGSQRNSRRNSRQNSQQTSRQASPENATSARPSPEADPHPDSARGSSKDPLEAPSKPLQRSSREPSQEPSQEPSKQPSKPEVHSQNDGSTRSKSESEDPVLAAKLAKFEKYEQKYPGLLRAYKLEKRKNELVRLYEKVLSEHTPCTSIAEPQELVNYLTGLSSRSDLQQKEIGKLNTDMTKTTSELAKLKAELASEKKRNVDLAKDLELAKQQTRQQAEQAEQRIAEVRTQAAAHADLQARAGESAQLRERITALEAQLVEAEASGSVGARAQATLRTQLDELGLRLAETQAELELVKDELAESERRGQDRLDELASVRNALRSRDKDRRRSTDEAASQLASLAADKEQLETEVEVLGRRIVRETEQLHVQLRSVRAQLRESEAHAVELAQELERQSSRAESALASPSPQPASVASEPVREASAARDAPGDDAVLAEAEAAASSAARANELLKQVNSDNALRIEKLQRTQRALAADLEQLRAENQRLRRRPSVTGLPDVEPAESSEKQRAYLRNVLLGFVEHKDQRKMLLPVIATLLGFEDGEEERILNSLK